MDLSPNISIDRYINTSYDIVKTVHDNLAAITLVSDNMTAVLNVSTIGDLDTIAADLATFAATPPVGIKAPCVVSTTANITLSNSQTINTVAVVNPNRVLVRNQTDNTENGVYVVTDAGAWVRASDWDGGTDLLPGMLVLDTHTQAFYRASFTGTYDPGTTALTFLSNTSFTGQMIITDTTVSTSGATGSIHAAGGIGAQEDMVTDKTFKPLGATAAADLAAFGYTAVNGAIITGTGSTNDVSLLNTGGQDVLVIPTGTTNVIVTGDITSLNGTLIPSGDTTAGDDAAVGYNVVTGLKLTGQGSTYDIAMFNDDANIAMGLYTGTLNWAMMDDLTVAGTIFATGGGITFPATQVPSANVNTLDDYEEGTWTPTLLGATNPTQSYFIQLGEYVKIGKIVILTGHIQMASTGISAGTGAVTIGGVPFTAGKSGGGSVFNTGTWLTGTRGAPTHIYILEATNILTVDVNDNDAGNVSGALAASAVDVQNSTRMHFTVTYEV